MKQKTLFDEENRLELLSQLGDPLEMMNCQYKCNTIKTKIF